MKKIIFAGLLLFWKLTAPVVAQTAQQYYNFGINYLSSTNLDAAYASFSNAVVLAPNNPSNNFFYALTSLAALPDTPAISNFLSDLGLPSEGRNLYHWKAGAATADGKINVPVGLGGDDFTAELRSKAIPPITNAETHLAAVTSSRFSIEIESSETHFSPVTVDYGDLLMMRALLDASAFFVYEAHSWNLNAQLSDISTILTQESASALLTNYPAALTVETTNDIGAGRAEFTNAINLYLAASEFIRFNRAPGVERWFNLSPEDATASAPFTPWR